MIRALVFVALAVASVNGLTTQDACPGLCLDTTKNHCSVPFLSGKCAGNANIRCCPTAKKAASKPAPTVPSNVPTPTPRPNTPAPVTPAPVPTTPATNYEGATCKGGKGVCQSDSKACNGGSYKTGMCQGPAAIKCCYPTAAVVPAPTTPAVNNNGASSPLPAFSAIWQAYPHGEAEDVKRRIGGGINAGYITNTCVIRVTRALAQAGYKIPPSFKLANKKPILLVKGADGVPLALRVAEFKEYAVKNFGPIGVKHINPSIGSADIPDKFRNKKGIIMFDVRVWSDASGHFDLWDGSSCAHQCYFDKAAEVWLWPLA